MPKKLNLIGEKYGRLLVLEEGEKEVRPSGRKYRTWVCQCECGEVIEAKTQDLRSGDTKSCGCLIKDKLTARNKENAIHNMRNTSEYRIWCRMKERCFNSNHKSYDRYGGRGITICDQWLNSFEQFYKDMGARPTPQHTIDRINPDEDYEPNNCRWATNEQQQQNRTNNKLDEQKVKEILYLLDAGELPKTIANLYRVSTSMIYNIKNKKMWKNINI